MKARDEMNLLRKVLGELIGHLAHDAAFRDGTASRRLRKLGERLEEMDPDEEREAMKAHECYIGVSVCNYDDVLLGVWPFDLAGLEAGSKFCRKDDLTATEKKAATA